MFLILQIKKHPQTYNCPRRQKISIYHLIVFILDFSENYKFLDNFFSQRYNLFTNQRGQRALDIPTPFLNKNRQNRDGSSPPHNVFGTNNEVGAWGPLNSLAGTGRNRLSQPPIFSAPAPQPESQSISSS